MEVTFHSDIEPFCKLCFPFLLKNEAENNLLFGILNALKIDLHRYSEIPPILISISNNDVLELVSIRTPPFNQVISFTQDLTTIDFLVEELANKRTAIPGILGFKEGALKFVQQWTNKTNQTYYLDMQERIYQLKEVNPTTLGSHLFEPAIKSEAELVFEWTKAFIQEALTENSPDEKSNLQKNIENAIERKMTYFLKVNDEIVSMAKKAGTTPNGQTINAVYTPPEYRRKGYGTEVVAKLSKKILDEGKKYCFLFTDLANPTSNKIYQKIGYQPIIDIDVYKFQEID